MVTVAQIRRALEDVLARVPESVARSSGFTQRASKLTAPVFVEALVFAWMSNPDASSAELVKFVAARGVHISPQGLDQRFTFRAAELVRIVLSCAVEHVLAADPAEAGILNRFEAVVWQDSSVITLPDGCAEVFASCGGSPGAPRSALKLHVQLEALSGRLCGPFLSDATRSDQALMAPHERAQPGHLQVKDRGFWDVGRFVAWDRAGVPFVSYLHTGTKVYDERGRELDLAEVLGGRRRHVQRRVRLSAKYAFACRLLAARVSREVEQARRERLAEYERKHGPATRLQRVLTRWSVVVTNVSEQELSLAQALVVMRSRWQIELLFKVWKTHLGADRWRSSKPARVLCEVLTKLLIGVLEHWIVLAGVWHSADRSLIKAANGLRAFGGALAIAFGHRAMLTRVLDAVVACLPCATRVTKRGANPSSAQLWSDCAIGP